MTDVTTGAPGTPWHLWVIGGVTLLWNLMGVVDFAMTQIQYEPYMSQFTEAQLEYFYGLPAWAIVFWAFGVFGAFIGSGLLLLRNKLAVHAFALSLLGMIVTTVYGYGLADGLKVSGTGALIFSIVIAVIAIFLLVYARAMASRSVLR
ncbi:MAG: hypothetical protein AAGJ29_07305 [Pseudomonadota bacterium]